MISFFVFIFLSFFVTYSSTTFLYTSYGVVLDAGSTGTTCFIFQWDTLTVDRAFPAIFPTPVGGSPWTNTTSPGLQTLVGQTSNVGSFLQPLINFAMDKLPDDSIPSTHIYVRGTSAMRRLSDAARTEILTAIRKYLSNSTNNPFMFKAEWASVLSEEEEGAMQWVSANLIITPQNFATGTVELGSSTLTMTYTVPPDSSYDSRILQDTYTFFISHMPVTVYTHSHTNFGLDDFHLSLLQSLVLASSTTTISNPCLPVNSSYIYTNLTVKGKTQTTYNFTGTGNAALCYSRIKALVVPNDCAGFNCTYQPAFPSTMNFRVLSRFARLALALGCNGTNQVGCLNRSLTTICKKNNSEINQLYAAYGNSSGYTVAQRLCTDGYYAYAILRNGLALADDRSVDFAGPDTAQIVNSWTLAVMTAEAGMWEVACDNPPPTTPAVTYYGVFVEATGVNTIVSMLQFQERTVLSNVLPVFSPVGNLVIIPTTLDAVANNSTALTAYLDQIVAALNSAILATAANRTLFNYAMLGSLRSLDLSTVNSVSSRMQTYFARYPFLSFSVSAPSVEQEQTTRWLTANVMAATLDAPSTIGLVELTPTSISVTFEPNETPLRGHFDVELPGGRSYGLYTHTYSGLGTKLVFDAILSILVRNETNVTAVMSVSHPCLMVGYTYTASFFPTGRTSPATANVSFTGSTSAEDPGHKIDQCRALIRKAVAVDSSNCLVPPCNSLATYQPAVPTDMLFMLANSSRFIPCFNNSDPEFCMRGLCNDPEWDASVPPLVAQQCFTMAYATVMLNEMLNVPETVIMTDPFEPTSPANNALGVYTNFVGLLDFRPTDCNANDTQRGIRDDAPLRTSTWFRIEGANVVTQADLPSGAASIIRAFVNTTVPIPLGGLRLVETTIDGDVSVADVRLKLSERPQDCRGTAPGTDPNGLAVDAEIRVGYFGPVTKVGSYQLCLKHRSLWETFTPNIVVTIETEDDPQMLYFGAQTCEGILNQTAHAQACGCYYEIPDPVSNGTLPPALKFRMSRDTPAFLIRRMTTPHLVNQGCCTEKAPSRSMMYVRNDTITVPARWGLCWV